MKGRKTKLSNRERGAHIVLFAILLTVFLSFAALVVGLGFVAIDRLRLQNITNLTALGALESYSRGGSSERTYTERAADALETAESVANENKLHGADTTLGTLYLDGATAPEDNGGVLEFGKWYEDASSCPLGNCCTGPGGYPCFVPNPGPPASQPNDTQATAVRVTLRTQPSNPIFTPFTRVFGESSVQIETQAIASIVERCTAFVLDISGSTAFESHRLALPYEKTDQPGLTPSTLISPDDLALVAYRANGVSNDCAASMPSDALEWHYWCNMGDTRSLPPATPKLHYRSDYRTFDTLVGRVLVDRYRDAEPLRSFMHGFNAALRTLQTESSAADRAMIYVFGRDARDRIPANGVTRDLGYLVQLTNIENGGRVDENGNWVQAPIHPNWVDRGWFPMWGTGGTNLVQAFHEVIEEMEESCPAHAKKSIILASDGVVTLDFARDGTPSESGFDSYGDSTDLSQQPNTYVGAERRLLSTSSTPGDPASSGILGDLLRTKISVTGILAGRHVRPNFLNVWTSEPAPGYPDGHFLNFFEAISQGYKGMQSPSFFDYSSIMPPTETLPIGVASADCHNATSPTDACAWEFNGIVDDVYFGRAVGLVGELVFRTGGVMCPVLPLGPESDYIDHDGNALTPKILNPSLRVDGDFQFISTEYIDPGSLAARCSRDTIGLNPFVLVREEG